MSTIYYKGLCQVEVQDLFSSTCVQLQKLCLGQVVTIVLGQIDTDGSASELCADNDRKNNMYITTTCERFISLVKPSVLVYNQYCKC